MRSGRARSGWLRRALPAAAFVRLQEADAALLLDQGAVRPRNARVFGERVEDAEGGLGVLARAVGFFERDAEPLQRRRRGRATFVGLDFARPHERVDPSKSPGVARAASCLRGAPSRANSERRNCLSNSALYAAGMRPRSASAISCATASNEGAEATCSSVMPCTSRDSCRDRDAGVQEPIVSCNDLAATADDDADLDDTIVRRVATGGLDVEQRDFEIAPRGVLRELRGEAADDRAEQMGDARIVPPARKAAAALEREARARAFRRSRRRSGGNPEPVHFLGAALAVAAAETVGAGVPGGGSLPLSWSSRSIQSSRLWLLSYSRPSM